jgi:hypothetical protein
MIKINVITNNNEWNLFLKNPNSYIDRKINKYNVKDKKYQKKIFIALCYSQETKKLKI